MTDQEAKQVSMSCTDPYQVGTKWLCEVYPHARKAVATVIDRCVVEEGHVLIMYIALFDLSFSVASSCYLVDANQTLVTRYD